MKSYVEASVPPGYFLDPVSVDFTFTPEVNEVLYSLNGAPPSISKYVAYDTSSPPVPFIAVTQDGRGNVAYDGGFPKLYNGSAPDIALPLNATFKYVVNTFDFVADKKQLEAGNRKVLILGDAPVSASYSVKGTGTNQFRTTLTRLCTVANYDPTFKDVSDYTGGLLDSRLSELKQYAFIIVLGSRHGNIPYITERSVDDIVTYREEGGGIFLITDHGAVYNTIESAMAGTSGFFVSVNRIAIRFGAWFSGDYNRVPINAGYLRRTYGDHPLYNGIADNEDIYAGGSESRVFVTESETHSPETVTKSFHFSTGNNVVQYAVVLEDGDIVSERFRYNIVDYKLTFSDGIKTVDSGGTINISTRDRLNLKIGYIGPASNSISGKLYLGPIEIGSYSKPAGVSEGTISYMSIHLSDLSIYGQRGIPVDNDSFIYLRLAPDYENEYTLRISRYRLSEIEMRKVLNLSNFNTTLNSFEYSGTPLDRLNSLPDDLRNDKYVLPRLYSTADRLDRSIKQLSGPGQVLPVDFILTPQVFLVSNVTWCGWFLYQTNAGNIEPKDYKGLPIRDINAQLSRPTELQLGLRDQMLPKWICVYVDGHGPFTLIREVRDTGMVNRRYYRLGDFNIYNYFSSKAGTPVEIRLVLE